MDFFNKIEEVGNLCHIRNFPVRSFGHKLCVHYKSIKITRLYEIVGIKIFKNSTITIHKFFIPELVYLLEKFHYPQSLIDRIIEHTWIRTVYQPVSENRVDLKLVKKHMNVKLYPHQQQFIETYDVYKQRYQLYGYLLGDSPGAGKTISSLGLMTALNKKKVIIIAPKSTLVTVWKQHIRKFFKTKKKVVVVNKDILDPTADFFIFNYESMDKLFYITNELAKCSKDIGCIVDESHNFLSLKSVRTLTLIKLRVELGIEDMLLMSGTPIKSAGKDLIPILMILDQYFDTDAIDIFKNTFGVNTTVATDVLKARLTTMMHRNDKNQILKLPDRFEKTINIKIPNGQDYTLTNVKNETLIFVQERMDYHNTQMEEYVSEFEEVVRYLSTTSIGKTEEFITYLQLVAQFRKTKVNLTNPEIKEKVVWVNEYEKTVIHPELSKELLKKFKHCKSAIKYIHLKIRGEVIGRLLMGLRVKMTSDMIKHSPIKEIIDESIKKTVVFTSYVDTLESVVKYLEEESYKPLTAYGKTSKYLKDTLDDFDNRFEYNPLVASINSLSTGVTLTVANTMIFLNKPWRSIEFTQTADRIHRIGQDTPVYIYSFLLDTGEEDNLSTRMESIINWSANMFAHLVNEDTTIDRV